jgi:hypothetical protein
MECGGCQDRLIRLRRHGAVIAHAFRNHWFWSNGRYKAPFYYTCDCVEGLQLPDSRLENNQHGYSSVIFTRPALNAYGCIQKYVRDRLSFIYLYTNSYASPCRTVHFESSPSFLRDSCLQASFA